MKKEQLRKVIKKYLKGWGCYKSNASIDKLASEIIDLFQSEDRMTVWATITLKEIGRAIEKGEIHKEDLEPELGRLFKLLDK